MLQSFFDTFSSDCCFLSCDQFAVSFGRKGRVDVGRRSKSEWEYVDIQLHKQETPHHAPLLANTRQQIREEFAKGKKVEGQVQDLKEKRQGKRQ